MSTQNPNEHFIQSLTESQNRLYGCIFSLLGNHHAAADVLQECNLVLRRKVGKFRAGSEFIPWSFGIARFQVMAHFRDQKREQARLLDPGRFEELQTSLRHCLGKPPEHGREMMERRYFQHQAVQEIATETQRNLSAVKVALMRLRQGLRECIERELIRASAS